MLCARGNGASPLPSASAPQGSSSAHLHRWEILLRGSALRSSFRTQQVGLVVCVCVVVVVAGKTVRRCSKQAAQEQILHRSHRALPAAPTRPWLVHCCVALPLRGPRLAVKRA